MKPLQHLACWLLAGATLSCPTEGADVRCGDCNVILVSIDTLRADHLGCYGYVPPTSPAIDAFRKSGVLFSTAIAHAPSTEPSHASMFTSLIPYHHGAWRARHLPISPDVPTLPEILARAGFRTASYNGGGQVGGSLGFGRGFEVYESAKAGQDRFADRVAATIGWIKANAGERFFVFLHTYEVHAPYVPERRHLELFDRGYAGTLPAEISPTLLRDINEGRTRIDEADLRHIVAAYDADVRSMDEAFGTLIRFLREADLFDRTLVVFTSDHGEEFGEHGSVGQHSHTLYDELLRVPLIVKLPRGGFAGRTVEEQVGGIDLLPTILDVVGVASDAPFHGRSLLPLLEGKKLEEPPVLSQLDTTLDPTTTSIRTRERKLIMGTPQLVASPAFQWFRDEARVVVRGVQVTLPLASLTERQYVDILVDGQRPRRERLSPVSRRIEMKFRDDQERTVTIRGLGPCTRPADLGLDVGQECVHFRVANPYEFYRLDRDAREQDNLYADPARATEIAKMKARIAEWMARRPAGTTAGQEVELDPETLRKLRALGYVN
jgi:hypothetical protein